MYVRLITTSFPCISTPGTGFSQTYALYTHATPEATFNGITGWQTAEPLTTEANPRCSIDVLSWYYLTSSFVYNAVDYSSNVYCGDTRAMLDATVSITTDLVHAFNMSEC